MRHSLLVLLILSMAIASFGVKFDVMYQWTYPNFTWTNRKQMKAAVKAGDYNPHKCMFYDVDVSIDGRIFVTLPRELGRGSPATLATVSQETTQSPFVRPKFPYQNQPLRPYPNWDWHNSTSCRNNSILNVHRMQIRCNHNFVLDNGKIGTDQICNPKILIFDLTNDKLVKTIYIPLDIATNNMGAGFLVALIVYVPGKCSRLLDEMIIFMADMAGSGLVMYDASIKRMCRIESDCMKPSNSSIPIGNETISYTAGTFSMTHFGKDLYYAPLSGMNICKIKIETLRKCPNKNEANKQTKLVTKLQSQTGRITSARRGIIYTDTHATSIIGMNVCKKFGKNKVELARDSEKMLCVSGLKVIPNLDPPILVGLSNNYARYITNTLDLRKKNIHIFKMNLIEVQKKMN